MSSPRPAPGRVLDAADNTRLRPDRTAAFMDIGTNSVRLLLVRITGNASYTVISKQKEMVRLGDGNFAELGLQPDAIDRAVLVCDKFGQMARGSGAGEIVTVATSATREAPNRLEFTRRLRTEAGINVRVISGLEEARLIYLGVSRQTHLGRHRALFMDVGGGSTELITGDENQYDHLESLELGAVRLANRFALNGPDPVTAERYELVSQHVYNRAIRAIQHLSGSKFDVAVGSSGTIQNLGDVAIRMLHGRKRTRGDKLSRSDLGKVIEELCGLPLEKRRNVPGINPKRADIIVAGAAIVDTIMEALKVDELSISDYGLQDGLLVDYLASSQHDLHARPLSVRERSALLLGRACSFDEQHARHVMKLSLELFDSSKAANLHSFGQSEREILQFAALLHDIGMFLAYQNHEAHSYYLIKNADLVGFDHTEVELIATTALFHRKRFPAKKYPEVAGLDKHQRRTVRVLSMLVRMAESLDRSHTSPIVGATLTVKNGDAVLSFTATDDSQLEEWNIQQHVDGFERVFKKKLTIAAATRIEPIKK